MKITATPIVGAWHIEATPFVDERGSFSRTFCQKTFGDAGLETVFVECNLSRNRAKATLRGLHMQTGEHAEVKLVRAMTGRIFDVALDLRPESASYRQWFGVELSAARQNTFYIPRGCAHGFITLEDHSDVFYQVSSHYAPGHEQGYRWDDAAFGIEWPLQPATLSDKDRAYPDYDARQAR
ncbi:dTDP-4-dehydrorhamnose 3,5-epimerase [Erwinia tracheiphila]|uniref:dTDP-4-dehydrorhamnose 3,5-epimerase n=1 Tax=Erwinia tracheiphila TaxID=65700 RepID=A0A345CQ73_9GAMM|nr:dTDP-4-dehydrorhamnose 3,5-epimerase [Erwinia tracheiphila]AXF75590.1 dTDP-4-dehydrorhamnose 3,5-epimerase [Erwinia tracheiphila]UIA81862.1 dTDP-4-dehydrorhamnose 3,5-epimerase [Erwinia tracheiphila]UIA90458.1 dTDP-4-dehydrorhamnose 3,5-epimerase [Erwinia tracheiphila]